MTGASREDQIILIQAALLISAVATLIQVFPVHKYCGSGLPVIMGASFAYIPMLISLGSRFDLPTIFGAQLVGGAVAILVGVFYKKINALFPPIVTGTVVFTIGLSLYPTAVNYMAGGTGAADLEALLTGQSHFLRWASYFSAITLRKGSRKWHRS